MYPQQRQGAMKQQMMEQATLQAVRAVEAQLDQQLKEMENLDTQDLAQIRQKRKAELKQKAAKMQEWKLQGHGTYSEVGDQKEWFQVAQDSERVITHFYRSSTWRCNIVDKHLSDLAKQHMETKFIKIDAEKSPYLAERLNIVLMPTIIMTKGGFTHDRIEGFDQLGGTDKFTTRTLEKRLAKEGMIEYTLQSEDPMDKLGKKTQGVRDNRDGKAIYQTRMAKMMDTEYSDEDWSDSD